MEAHLISPPIPTWRSILACSAAVPGGETLHQKGNVRAGAASKGPFFYTRTGVASPLHASRTCGGPGLLHQPRQQEVIEQSHQDEPCQQDQCPPHVVANDLALAPHKL